MLIILGWNTRYSSLCIINRVLGPTKGIDNKNIRANKNSDDFTVKFSLFILNHKPVILNCHSVILNSFQDLIRSERNRFRNEPGMTTTLLTVCTYE